MRADGRIEPGQPIGSAISARAWNRAQDAADIVFNATPSVALPHNAAVDRPYTWVYVKNNSGASVGRWGILSINGVSPAPDGSEDSDATKLFQQTPLLSGGAPGLSKRQWVVCVEPIAAGSIGRAAVSGIVQCKVHITNTSHEFVVCTDSTTQLTSAQHGAGEIVWRQGAGENQWALVRLGASSRVVRGRFSGYWQKGQTFSVTDLNAPSTTYATLNNIASIQSAAPADCLIAWVRGDWVLLAWDWESLLGYNGQEQQLLSHSATGVLEWASTTECE